MHQKNDTLKHLTRSLTLAELYRAIIIHGAAIIAQNSCLNCTRSEVVQVGSSQSVEKQLIATRLV